MGGAWQIFNASFIAAYQHALLLLISAGPMSVAFAMKGNRPSLTSADLVATCCFVSFLALEAAADQQQWRFQQAPQLLRGARHLGVLRAVRGASRRERTGDRLGTLARAARRLWRDPARALVPRVDEVHGEHHAEKIPRVRRVPKMHVATRAVAAVRDRAAGVQAEEAEGLAALRDGNVTSLKFYFMVGKTSQ